MLRAIAFDFDGVLVESARIKTDAFEHLFASEDEAALRRIIEYHVSHGGIARFEKFRFIYREILKRPLSEAEFARLCERFHEHVFDAIVAAPWVEGAREFLTRQRGRYRFFVVSGTPEEELVQIIRRRGITELFDAVTGAPTAKPVLLRRLMDHYGVAPSEMVFVGDAESDWLAAQAIKVAFIWRRSLAEAQAPPSFGGPQLESLAGLEACLLELAGGKVRAE